jgi:hypothetical protein
MTTAVLYKATAANIWHYDGAPSYQNDPVECHLSHTVYVLVAGACLKSRRWHRAVQDCRYNDNNKTVVTDVALPQPLSPLLDREDDGIEEDTGMNVSL